MSNSWTLKGLQGTFTGRQLTDQELETLASWRIKNPDFRIYASRPDRLEVEQSHSPDAQDLNPQTYFKDLVSKFTSAESLPRFTNTRGGSESIPLYGLDTDGRPSLPKDTASGEGFALAMRVLPRMLYYNLGVRLQREMSLMLENRTTDDTQMERVRSLLKQYAELKRDQEVIRPDIMDAEASLVDAILKSSSGASKINHDSASQPKGDSYDLKDSPPRLPQSAIADTRGTTRIDIGVSQTTQNDYFRAERRERLARRFGMRNRLIAAVLGGLSLVVPMLIMAIKPSQLKTLITSSVAVLLFSLGLAWKSSARTETLLATTAAYAAVMVVFVGVNSN